MRPPLQLSFFLVYVIKGRQDSGKTTAVKEIAQSVSSELNVPLINRNNRMRTEICVYLEYKGKKIGFSSHGDFPEDSINSRLNWLVNEIHCDIVVCAARDTPVVWAAYSVFLKNHDSKIFEFEHKKTVAEIQFVSEKRQKNINNIVNEIIFLCRGVN